MALGCHIDSTGSTEVLIKGRLAEGRKMFAKLRPMLCSPKIPEEERIMAFDTTVASSVLWGAGCWSPSTNAQQLLSIQENRWLRSMLGGRKGQDVEWVVWLRATKREAHVLRSKLSLPVLWHRALADMHGWAGHGPEKGCAPWSRCNLVAKVLTTSPGGTRRRTGYAASSTLYPRSLAWAGGTQQKSAVAKAGREKNAILSAKLCGNGEDPG